MGAHSKLKATGKIKLWKIRQGLLHADQICLSRLQIHVLCCLALPCLGSSGNVDIEKFLATCSVVIPHMFDAQGFEATAERLILEAAEAQRQRENAELAALGGKMDSMGEG